MTKTERELKEYQSLFTDERYAKQAWKKMIGESLQSNAAFLPDFLTSKGDVAPQSIVYSAARDGVVHRLRERGLDREPTKAEVLIEANVIRAAFDNQVFNTLLDRTAGKVKEEVNVTTNSYEELSDEELELLMAHRQAKLGEGQGNGDA